ncbi:MAG: hypothetical protein ACJA1W_001071 [Akkermansiaceae bacterium]
MIPLILLTGFCQIQVGAAVNLGLIVLSLFMKLSRRHLQERRDTEPLTALEFVRAVCSLKVFHRFRAVRFSGQRLVD